MSLNGCGQVSENRSSELAEDETPEQKNDRIKKAWLAKLGEKKEEPVKVPCPDNPQKVCGFKPPRAVKMIYSKSPGSTSLQDNRSSVVVIFEDLTLQEMVEVAHGTKIGTIYFFSDESQSTLLFKSDLKKQKNLTISTLDSAGVENFNGEKIIKENFVRTSAKVPVGLDKVTKMESATRFDCVFKIMSVQKKSENYVHYFIPHPVLNFVQDPESRRFNGFWNFIKDENNEKVKRKKRMNILSATELDFAKTGSLKRSLIKLEENYSLERAVDHLDDLEVENQAKYYDQFMKRRVRKGFKLLKKQEDEKILSHLTTDETVNLHITTDISEHSILRSLYRYDQVPLGELVEVGNAVIRFDNDPGIVEAKVYLKVFKDKKERKFLDFFILNRDGKRVSFPLKVKLNQGWHWRLDWKQYETPLSISTHFAEVFLPETRMEVVKSAMAAIDGLESQIVTETNRGRRNYLKRHYLEISESLQQLDVAQGVEISRQPYINKKKTDIRIFKAPLGFSIETEVMSVASFEEKSEIYLNSGSRNHLNIGIFKVKNSQGNVFFEGKIKMSERDVAEGLSSRQVKTIKFMINNVVFDTVNIKATENVIHVRPEDGFLYRFFAMHPESLSEIEVEEYLVVASRYLQVAPLEKWKSSFLDVMRRMKIARLCQRGIGGWSPGQARLELYTPLKEAKEMIENIDVHLKIQSKLTELRPQDPKLAELIAIQERYKVLGGKVRKLHEMMDKYRLEVLQ